MMMLARAMFSQDLNFSKRRRPTDRSVPVFDHPHVGKKISSRKDSDDSPCCNQ